MTGGRTKEEKPKGTRDMGREVVSDRVEKEGKEEKGKKR